MDQNIQQVGSCDAASGAVRHRRCRRSLRFAGAATFALVASAPVRVFAQVADPAPTNAGLPGGALVAQVLGWAKWLGLAACIIAIVYGAATWRGMGGNRVAASKARRMSVPGCSARC